MSKLVKNLLVDDLKGRLAGVNEVIVVSLGRLDGTKTTTTTTRPTMYPITSCKKVKSRR